MGQLYQVAVQTLWVLTAVAAAAIPCTPQSYCSLTVRVLYPDGQPADALVTVEEKNGRVERRRQETGDVRFCDLGAHPVSVKVGLDGTCNQVIVHNVPVAWNVATKITVTYDVDPCLVETPPPPSPVCRIVFRVADAGGKWLPGVPIRIRTPMVTVLRGDDFGRASFVTRVGDQVTGSVEAQGYGPFQFHAACAESERVHEEDIRLNVPRGGQPGQIR